MAAAEGSLVCDRPSTLKSYVDRFRKGDPRSREEREADAARRCRGTERGPVRGGRGDGFKKGTEDFWWLNSGNVTTEKGKTVAERPYHVSNSEEKTEKVDRENDVKDAISGVGNTVNDRVTSIDDKTNGTSFQSGSPSSTPSKFVSFSNAVPKISNASISRTQGLDTYDNHLVPPDRTEEQQLDDIVTRKLMYQRREVDDVGRIPPPTKRSTASSSGIGVISSRGLGSEGADSPEEGAAATTMAAMEIDGRSSPPAQLQFVQTMMRNRSNSDKYNDNDGAIGRSGVESARRVDDDLRQRLMAFKAEGRRVSRPANPEDDILYQWRLRRKLQEARDGVGKRVEAQSRMEIDMRRSSAAPEPETDTNRKRDSVTVSDPMTRGGLAEEPNFSLTKNSANGQSQKQQQQQQQPAYFDQQPTPHAPFLHEANPTKSRDVATSPLEQAPNGSPIVLKPSNSRDVATSPRADTWNETGVPSSHLSSHASTILPPQSFPYPFPPFFVPHHHRHHPQTMFPIPAPAFYHPYIGQYDLELTDPNAYAARSLNLNNNNRNGAAAEGRIVEPRDARPAPDAREASPRSCLRGRSGNVQRRPGPCLESGPKSSPKERSKSERLVESDSNGKGNTRGSDFGGTRRRSTSLLRRRRRSEDEGGGMGRRPSHEANDIDERTVFDGILPPRSEASKYNPETNEPSPSSATKTRSDNLEEPDPSSSSTTIDRSSSHRNSNLTDPIDLATTSTIQKPTVSSSSSSHRDLTVVSSLSSFSSSHEDINSIVFDDDDDEEKEFRMEKIFGDPSRGKERAREVVFSPGKKEGEEDEDGQVAKQRMVHGDHEKSDGADDDDDDDDIDGDCMPGNRARPTRCEDFESDESEFEDDEILIVLRKKRKELIRKLWLIDESINGKKIKEKKM